MHDEMYGRVRAILDAPDLKTARLLYDQVVAKEIQKMVGNKSKYTDWTSRQDVKDELYTDVAVRLKRNGYPPRTIDDACDEIMKQVENYKQYEA